MSVPAELAISTARPAERQALEDLQRRASLALDDYREQLEAEPDAISLPASQVDAGLVYAARLGGRLAGFAALLPGEGHVELDGLFVEPDLWGRGIGRALVRVAVHEARRQGLAMMVVANPKAREFYEKCGFTVEGPAATRFGPALRMSR